MFWNKKEKQEVAKIKTAIERKLDSFREDGWVAIDCLNVHRVESIVLYNLYNIPTSDEIEVILVRIWLNNNEAYEVAGHTFKISEEIGTDNWQLTHQVEYHIGCCTYFNNQLSRQAVADYKEQWDAA